MTKTRFLAVGVALAFIAVVFGVDRIADVTWPDDLVWWIRVLLIVAAVVIAAVSYQVWSTKSGDPGRLLVAMITSLVGGAALTSSVMSSQGSEVFSAGALPAVAVVALIFAISVLNLEMRESGKSS